MEISRSSVCVEGDRIEAVRTTVLRNLQRHLYIARNMEMPKNTRKELIENIRGMLAMVSPEEFYLTLEMDSRSAFACMNEGHKAACSAYR